MLQKQYHEIRPTLQTGDLIAFGGNSPLSIGIKIITHCNVSHVATVLHTYNQFVPEPVVQIIESTSLGDGFAGVQINRLSTRISKYKGNIWILPLNEGVKQKLNLIDFISFMINQNGKPYDVSQAIGSALDLLIPDNREDYSKFFCSELCTAGLKAGFKTYFSSLSTQHIEASLYNSNIDMFETINASEQTPADCLAFPIWNDVTQVCGKPTELF